MIISGKSVTYEYLLTKNRLFPDNFTRRKVLFGNINVGQSGGLNNEQAVLKYGN